MEIQDWRQHSYHVVPYLSEGHTTKPVTIVHVLRASPGSSGVWWSKWVDLLMLEDFEEMLWQKLGLEGFTRQSRKWVQKREESMQNHKDKKDERTWQVTEWWGFTIECIRLAEMFSAFHTWAQEDFVVTLVPSLTPSPLTAEPSFVQTMICLVTLAQNPKVIFILTFDQSQISVDFVIKIFWKYTPSLSNSRTVHNPGQPWMQPNTS